MTADINAEHLFFKAEAYLLAVLLHIRVPDLVRLPLLLRHQIKEAHLPRHHLLFLLILVIDEHTVNHHHLLSVAVEPVARARLDEILYGAFVDLPTRHALNKILQGLIRTVRLPLLHNRIHDRTPDALDRIQTIANALLRRRKTPVALVDIRREHRNPHLTTAIDILRHLSRVIDDRRHKRRHKLDRIIIFEICGLVSDHRIRRRMGFVKRVLREIDHGIVDLVRRLLADAVRNTSPDALLLISINKIMTLRVDDILLLLAHCAPDIIRLSHRIARKILYDLHDLLLIDDTAVSRL